MSVIFMSVIFSAPLRFLQKQNPAVLVGTRPKFQQLGTFDGFATCESEISQSISQTQLGCCSLTVGLCVDTVETFPAQSANVVQYIVSDSKSYDSHV